MKGRTIAMIDWTLDGIKDVINVFEESDLTKIEIADGDKKILLSREIAQTSQSNNNSMVRGNNGFGMPQNFQSIARLKEMQDELASAKESLSKAGEKPNVVKKASAVTGSKEGTYIKASMAGILYMQPKPGEKPYIEIGKRVKKGDTVALIEAMKMINEINAPSDGIIKEIFFQNEQFVEYDSPLILMVEE